MARQEGVFSIQGLVGNLIYYETRYGKLVRHKGTLDRNRIANDPAFLPTRENNTEFGNAARAGKLLRATVRGMENNACDNRVTSRINKVMIGIKSFDALSGRGNRTVGNGIANAAAQQLLKGFNFNVYAILNRILLTGYTVTTDTGVITIHEFTPLRHVEFPAGATHLTLQGGFAHVDFTGGAGELQMSNALNLMIDNNSTDVVLVPVAVPALNGTSIYLLKVSFFQMVNRVQYLLKDGVFNSLEIVEIV